MDLQFDGEVRRREQVDLGDTVSVGLTIDV
jgi:hypothetical protein